MTLKPRTAFIVSFAFAVVAAAAVSAQGPGPGPGGRGIGPGRGPGPLPMLQRLDLTDAQKEQVRALVAERPAAEARRTLDSLHRDLMNAILADSPDTAKIEQLKTSIADAESSALTTEVDLQLRIAQILTPEQRQKARELPAGPRGR
jgi:Spy/CpxP family protein refolding chaperone